MFLRVIAIFSTLLLGTNSLQAQKDQGIYSTWQSDVTIDGSLNEWGDSLLYYFQDQDLHYSISNDNNYLYVAIKVKNKDKQTQASFNGFALTINKENKKSDGPRLIFPIPDRSALNALSHQEFDTPNDLREKALSTIRAIYVRNFSDILDGRISLENNYGIKAAIKIDTADHLCYEAAIRLDQLKLPPDQNSFSLNLKINGLIKTEYTYTGARRNRRGLPYGYGNSYGNYDQPRRIINKREEPGTWQFITLSQRP